MVILRLQRIGRKKEPHFRLIAQDKKKDQWDKSIEILGWLNPRSKEKTLKKERVEYWLSVGAQCTDRVHNWLIDEGILKQDKRNTIKISKKRKSKKEGKKKAPTQKVGVPTDNVGKGTEKNTEDTEDKKIANTEDAEKSTEDTEDKKIANTEGTEKNTEDAEKTKDEANKKDKKIANTEDTENKSKDKK
ncbi:30S ribosomal protein S16 [Patescibacteria group bacterium]